MKLFKGLIGIVSFMNIFAGIVGGIWLIILGKWQIPVLGLVIALLVTNVVFPMLLLPGYGLAKLGITNLEAGRTKSFVFFQLLNWVINLIWITVFVYITFHAVLSYGAKLNLVPIVLVAYALVAGPLGEMAIGEEDSDGPTKMIIILVDVGMIAMSVALLIGLSLAHTLLVFAPFAVFAVIWGMVGAYSAIEENKHLRAT